MKKLDLSKWEINDGTNGLLFFGSLISELLFDYTIDSFKLPALNTRTLSEELGRVIDDVDSGLIKDASMAPIVEELCDSLSKDLVAKYLLGEYCTSFIADLKKASGSIVGVKERVAYLRLKIQDIYFETCKKLLKECLKDKNRKNDIHRLTKIFLTELVRFGYSASYIYFESDRYFFSGRDGRYPRKVTSPEDVNGFFELFQDESQKWNVLFRVSRSFNCIKKIASSIDITIDENVSDGELCKKSKAFSELLRLNAAEYPLYLTFNNVKAKDYFKARELAEDRIERVETLAKYHVHKIVLSWYQKAGVYITGSEYCNVLEKPVPAIFKRPDIQEGDLAKKIEETLNLLTSNFSESDSLRRIITALDLHRTALVSPTIENQLVNFWAAAETLFPPINEGTSGRVVQMADCFVPFIGRAYVAKLATYLFRAIQSCGGSGAIDMVQRMDMGKTPLDSFVLLVCVPDYKQDLDMLLALLAPHNPVLANRIFYISDRFSSAAHILETMEAHNQRVRWQIMRIYRTRNSIVHAGQAMSYLGVLVENLHSYLDRVLDLLYDSMGQSKSAINIEETVAKYKYDLHAHLDVLRKHKGEKCTKDNYLRFLFGA